MSEGSITFSTALDNRQLEKDLAALTKKIAKKEQEIAGLRTKLAGGKEKSLFDAAELDAEKAKLQEIQDRLADIRAMSRDKDLSLERREEVKALIPSVQGEMKDQQTRVNALQAAWNRTEDAVDRYAAQLTEAESELERQKEKAGALQQQIHQADQARAEELNRAQVADQSIVELNRELVRLKERQAQLAQAGLGLGHQEYDQVAKSIAAASEELKKYQENLRGVQETPAQMGKATQRAAGYMSSFGKRLKGILASAFLFNILSAGLQQFTGWVGKSITANDQARQAIAKLKGALLTLAQPLVEVIIPAFTLLVNILARVVTAIAQVVSALFGKTLKQSKDGAKVLYHEANALEGVGSAADEAAGSLAGFDEVNTISTDTGGGGGGALNDTIKPDFTGMIEGELSKISALVGAALLAVGAILTFSGANIPLGIALMAAGAITLVSVMATDWGSIAEMLQGPIGMVTAIASAALLALGAILAFSGVNIPLGIALMALGAIGLAAVAAANWDSLSEVLRGPIGTLTAVVSTALLALGALLAFSAVNIPLGIALMAAGAIGLVAVAAANWTALETALQGPIGNVTAVVSAALLALGAILAFSGVNIPLGIALMAAGAVGLAAVVAANWSVVEQTLKGPVGAITALISTALLALGAVILFSGSNIPMGLGLMVAGAVGLATTIAANWESVQNALRGPIGIVTTMVSTALLALGAILLFTGANIPLGLGLLTAGAMGLAATIAANWNTITAAAGGTIQAITTIVSAALLVLGVVLLFTGAAAPLGMGLLAAGAIGLAATIVPNWDFILEAVKGAWSNLKNWWNTNAAKFFTFDYWAGLGEGIITGLLNGLKSAWNSVTRWVSDAVSWIGNMFGGTSGSDSSIRNVGAVKRPRVTMEAMPSISAYRVPALARGAVIPPNREFMAVLGDQHSGNNLEAPEELIRKIVREESRGGGDYTALLQAILEAVKAGHIIVADRRVLAQVVTQEQNRTTRQSGRSVLLT